MSLALLAACFFVTALLYSSAGFGGGSSYLALLVLWKWDPASLPIIALVCNIVVVTQGSILFQRKGHLKWRFAVPFLAASVPLAFLGGLWKIPLETWRTLLGASLLLAGGALLLPASGDGRDLDAPERRGVFWGGIPVGGALGLLSGLVGIGGGIFLAPLLHFARLGTARQIAALSSAFILFNSLSGLTGQLLKHGGWSFGTKPLLLLGAVFVGGQIGSRLGSSLLSHRALRIWTALLVFFAGLRILLKF